MVAEKGDWGLEKRGKSYKNLTGTSVLILTTSDLTLTPILRVKYNG